jgi:hypothetical protein
MTGCGKNKEKEKTEYESNAVYQMYGGEYTNSQLIYLGENSMFHILDVQSGTDAILCNKIDCAHETYDENSNSECFAATDGFVRVYFTDDNKMYYLYMDSVMKCSLYESDEIGVTKEKVMSIDGITDIRYYDYDEKNKLLVCSYITQYKSDDENSYIPLSTEECLTGILIVDIENMTYNKIMEHEAGSGYEEGYDIPELFVKNGIIYYVKTYFDGLRTDMEAMIENGQWDEYQRRYMYNYCSYNVENGEEQSYLLLPLIDVRDFRDNNFYYYIDEDFVIYDAETGESVTIDGFRDSVPIFQNGDYMGFYTYGYDEDGENYTYDFYTYDFSDGECKKVGNRIDKGRFGVDAYTGNYCYFRLCDSEGTFEDWAIVPLEDYINGNADIFTGGKE